VTVSWALFLWHSKWYWTCSASIVRRQSNVHNQSWVYTTAQVSSLKNFEVCLSDPEISPDGHVPHRTLSLLPERTRHILTIQLGI
jgi:hypothetical protein